MREDVINVLLGTGHPELVNDEIGTVADPLALGSAITLQDAARPQPGAK